LSISNPLQIQQSDTQANPVVTVSDTLVTPRVTKPEIKIKTELLKPSAEVDSLFISMEKKKIQYEVIEQRQALEKKKAANKKAEIDTTLPGQLDIFDNAFTVNHFKLYGNQKSFRPVENDLLIYPGKGKDDFLYQTKVQKISKYPSDFFLLFTLSITLIILFTKVFFRKYIDNFFQMALNYQLTNNMFRDKNVFMKRFNIALNLVYIIVVSIFIYQFVYFFDIKKNLQKIDFVYIIIFISTLAIVRLIVMKILGEIFAVQKEFSEYLFNQFMFNKLLGLILIPLAFTIPYVPNFMQQFLIYIGLLLISITFLVKLFRGFTIIIKKDVLIFYVLLYLCTLEILPILVGYTYFKKLI